MVQEISLEQKLSNPQVSIIILNFNGLKFLSGCLNSLFNSNYSNFEVIFVDNNSSDGSVEFVKKVFGKNLYLKIIELNENYGVGRGNNIGSYNAKGKYLIFLNMDIEVHPDWINEIIKIFEKDNTIGAAQPKLLFLWDKKRINSMGHYLTAYGDWSNYVPYGQLDDNKDDNIKEIFIAFGAAIAVNSQIFKKVGMFDEDFFMYSEETDLCWRIWLSGYKVVLVPSSVVYHYEGGATGSSIIKVTPKRAYYHTRNLLITMLKNYNNFNMFKYLPLSILNIFYGSLINIFINPRLITYHILAIVDFIRKFKNTWRKHISIKYLIRCIPDDLLFKKGLIRLRKKHITLDRR